MWRPRLRLLFGILIGLLLSTHVFFFFLQTKALRGHLNESPMDNFLRLQDNTISDTSDGKQEHMVPGLNYPDFLDRRFVDDSDITSLTHARISSRTMEWFASNKHTKFDVSLVISHCDKDFSWIFRSYFPEDFQFHDITIYSKCGNKVDTPQSVQANATVIRLPNIGRCDHTYAYHLARLDTTKLQKDHIVIFLKDNNYRIGGPKQTTNVKELLNTAYINGFACLARQHPLEFRRSKNDKKCPISAYHHTKSLEKTSFSGTYSREKKRDKTDEFYSEYKTLGQWTEAFNVTLPSPFVPLCWGGQFATTVAQVEERKSDWDKLEQGLSRGNNIIEGHYAERIWAGLLTKKLSTSSEHELINRIEEIKKIPQQIDAFAGALNLFC